MLLGRWLGSRILRTTKPALVLFISLALAMIGFFVFWSSLLIWIALSGFFLSGFGVANLYPISLDHAISSVPTSQSSIASARSALASASAILSLPLILGNLADQTGMRTAFMIVPIIILAAFFLNTFLAKRPNPGKITQQENENL
jgi:predicted MFS family arabinose efflux permease